MFCMFSSSPNYSLKLKPFFLHESSTTMASSERPRKLTIMKFRFASHIEMRCNMDVIEELCAPWSRNLKQTRHDNFYTCMLNGKNVIDLTFYLTIYKGQS